MSYPNNVEQQCFKRVWKKTLRSVYKNPTNAMIMAETKSVQQVNVNLKKKKSRRRRKKKNKQNICDCCMDRTRTMNGSISTLNSKGSLFLHHVPWGCLNTVCVNGMQFANINSLKSFLSVRDSHQFADEQLKKNARLRDAFGISEFFIEGSSLDPERKIKEAALAQLKALQVDQALAQTQMNEDTSTNKDSSIANELQSKSPKHKKRKKKKSKSHKSDKEKGSEKKKSKKHKKKHYSSSEDSSRIDEVKANKNLSLVKSKYGDDKSNKIITETKKKYDSDNNHKKHKRDNDKTFKNDTKEIEYKYKSDRDDYRKKDSKPENFKNLKKDKVTEEPDKTKSIDIFSDSKKHENSPRHRTPIKERDRDRERDYDKYRDDSKSNKEKSDRADSKYNSRKRNSRSPVKELKKKPIQPSKLTCIPVDSDSDKSCYTPPPKGLSAKLSQSNINEEKNSKSTKYTFSLREDSEDSLVVAKSNGRTDDLKSTLQNSENQHKKPEFRKTNDHIDQGIFDSTTSEEGGLDEDIDLNIIKEITTEKIKKVFELHEKQEQALLHLKKKLMEKKRKIRTSSSSSQSSDEEPVKKKSVKRRRVKDSSSSNSDVNTRKKSKRSRSSSSSSSASDTSVDHHKSLKRSKDKYSKKKSPPLRRRTKDSTSRSRSVSVSSNERLRKKRVSSSEESSPRRKHKSSKRKRSSRRQRSSVSSSSSRSSPSYKNKRRYSSSRSRSTSSSSSSHYSRSSSSSRDSSSSGSSRSSKSRSASIPRRRGSPSFLDRRRITRLEHSARKRPIPYTRLTPFSTNSDTDSVISVHDSPIAESH
ncbi:serine/arginine repetitive matrix protein 2 isoform X2 [Myzus persicae]|uniref:serine/arginine repetitive matrix protein 2 isoform X2 n=1 Tax=Myzus persicae TaxID=13164 RepID=UPI000B931E77|nr:serine/arginine repetitive matrix protein 2 isoform X2 [Myzus persicae]